MLLLRPWEWALPRNWANGYYTVKRGTVRTYHTEGSRRISWAKTSGDFARRNKLSRLHPLFLFNYDPDPFKVSSEYVSRYNDCEQLKKKKNRKGMISERWNTSCREGFARDSISCIRLIKLNKKICEIKIEREKITIWRLFYIDTYL